MKNIPLFTGTHGTASLIFQEIPVSGKAYVLIRSVWTTLPGLLEECRQFCTAVGAEQIFVSYGTEELPGAHAYDLIAMTCAKKDLPLPAAEMELEPLTPENGEAYLQIYNRSFASVSGAATYGQKDLRRLYDRDLAWLVRKNGGYAAVAEISEEGLEAIAVLPEFAGLGYDLAAAVLQMVPRTTVSLKVAGDNPRARRLYDRLGFRESGIVSRWWKIL